MTELTKVLGKSYDNADFQNLLKKILGKSYEKLKKLTITTCLSQEKYTTNLRTCLSQEKLMKKLRRSYEKLKNIEF